MPQGPIAVQIASLGGQSRTLNITAATVIKATPGTIFRVFTSTVGSAGALVINDNTVTGGSNVAANTVQSIPFGAPNLVAGAQLVLEVPCVNGIVISAVPTGWVGSVSWS